jgi:hypothetical protein
MVGISRPVGRSARGAKVNGEMGWTRFLAAGASAAILVFATGSCSRDDSGTPSAQDRAVEPKTKITRINADASSNSPASVASQRAASGAASQRNPARNASPSDKPTTAPDAETTAPEGMVTIAGKVTLEGGAPAAGATVTANRIKAGWSGEFLDQDNATSVTAGADGSYRLTLPEDAMAMVLSASLKGCVPSTAYVGGSPEGKLPKSSGKNLALLRSAELAGRVLDDRGRPVAARITAAMVKNPEGVADRESFPTPRADEKTTGDGVFALSGLLPGEATVSAKADGFAAVTKKVTVPVKDVEIRLGAKGGTIEGTVFVKPSGAAVSSASVRLLAGQRNASPIAMFQGEEPVETDGLGAFEIRNVASGSYRFMVGKEKLGMWPGERGGYTISIEDGQTTSGIELFLYPGHTVSGTVTDKATGKPLEGVRVSYGTNKGEQTGTDGRYRLEGVIAGAFQPGATTVLQVSKEGYSVEGDRRYGQPYGYVSVQLGSGKLEVEKDIQMVPSISISGRVQTEKGDPVAGAKLGLMDESHRGGNQSAESKVDGSFKLEASPFMRVRVKASATGYAAAFTEILSIEEKSLTDVVVTMLAGSTVSGVVVDPAGAPVEGADVIMNVTLPMGRIWFSETSGRGKSGPDGTFSISNVAAGQNSVGAKKKGFAPSKSQQVTLENGKDKTDLRLELRTAHFIAGHVYDKEKKPVAEAHVYFYSPTGAGNSDSVRSDADGKYRAEDVPEGIYNGSCNAPSGGLNAQREGIAVDRDDVDFILGAGEEGTLIGRVVDWQTGAPVKDFSVEPAYSGIERNDNEPGVFRMPMRPGVTYGLVIRAKGYADLAPDGVIIPKGQKTLEKEFKMGPGGSITGRAVRMGERTPLAGVRVTLTGSGPQWMMSGSGTPTASVTTGEDGKFLLEKAAAGVNQVEFKPQAPLTTISKPATVAHGQTADLGDVEIGGGASLKGRIVRMPGEQPMAGEPFTASGNNGSFQKSLKTDANGQFELTGLVPDTYGIRGTDHNFTSVVILGPEESKEVIIRIGGATLKGTITTDGAPVVASVNLTMSGTGQSVFQATQSDSEGKYEIKDLAGGRYQVNIYARSGSDTQPATLNEWIDIVADKENLRDFELPSGKLVGQVVDESGGAVAGARVSASAVNPKSADQAMVGRTWSGTSDDSGNFSIGGMTPGPYSVSARKDGAGAAPAQQVEVPSRGESARVTLKLAAEQTGTVVSVALNYSNSQPVPEAWCYLNAPTGRFEHGQQRDAQGVVTIQSVPVGSYRVEVSSWGFSEGVHEIEVKAGETVRLEDVLYEAGALRWNLTDLDGVAVPGVDCQLVPDDPNSIEKPRSGKADQGGLWIARGLFPGSYTATANAPGKKTTTAKVSIIAHQPASVVTKME